MANTNLVTTGEQKLVVHSTELFQLSPFLNSIPWLLAGGTVNLILTDPNGATTTISATIAGYTATAPWTVATPRGDWQRQWDVTDATGIRQVSLPLGFGVQ